MDDGANALPAPRFERVGHELRRRTLTVTAIEYLGPAMVRVTLTGPDMEGFRSLAPDDHLKVIVPGEGGEDLRRDYTPRRFDVARNELVIDFALHEAGPVSDWARQVAVGQELSIGGPRGSRRLAGEVKNWLLIGDETALPAIGRRIEELPADARVTAVVAVPDAQGEQVFDGPVQRDLHWIHRAEAQATDPILLLDVVRVLPVEPGTFVWIAAEAGVARALKLHFLVERLHPKGWLQARGYWVKGQADETDNLEDE